MTYHGGVIMPSSNIYPIFWGTSWPSYSGDKETGIDLLFTDMVMPGAMSGAELAAEVRHRLPAVPVLFTSGYAEPDRIKDVAIESDQWLQKPYTAADLAHRLKTIFDKARR